MKQSGLLGKGGRGKKFSAVFRAAAVRAGSRGEFVGVIEVYSAE